jgi:hypothetical protein
MNFLNKLLRSVRSELRYQWRTSKFGFLPGENNFLESLWFRCDGWKKMLRGRTTLQYLDWQIRWIRSGLSDPRLPERKKVILSDFLDALHNANLREEIILFLEKETFYPEVAPELWAAIHAEWRVPVMNVRMVRVGAEAALVETISSTDEQAPVLQEDKISAPESAPAAEPAGEAPPELYAKTYVIGAHIFFELTGKEAEYEALSHQLGDLGIFIRAKFNIQKLPGTFSKLKGYSYKRVLEGKNTSKKGQIRPCLRQIIDHPSIFGEDISHHALQLLDRHFKD